MVTSSHSRPGTPSPAGSTPPPSEPDDRRRTTGRSAPPTLDLSFQQRAGIWIRKHRVGPYLRLLPATAVIGALILWPAVQVGLFSFQNYGLMQISGVLPTQWIGFSNYSQILHDPEFWRSLKTSL
ncbi:MAG: putative sugar transporter rane protein, partial [Actinomycetia bacterium]|nr:putative sugar transporter rane protein [Actinomycetes bacterium]